MLWISSLSHFRHAHFKTRRYVLMNICAWHTWFLVMYTYISALAVTMLFIWVFPTPNSAANWREPMPFSCCRITLTLVSSVNITRFLVAIVNTNNGLRQCKSVSWDNRLPLANQLQARTCAAGILILQRTACDEPERCGYRCQKWQICEVHKQYNQFRRTLCMVSGQQAQCVRWDKLY